jgi:uncharacterized protein with NRDE domain
VCTVTYIGIKNGFILTSNRDEVASRPTLTPSKYNIEDKNLFFPKDEVAEGSWIASDEDGQVACLLNGAIEKHKRNLPYNRSRGKILIESFSYQSFSHFIDQVNLTNIEPFTLILVNNSSLTELLWDGNTKHKKNLNKTGNHIWSSVTLYPTDIALMKKQWFLKWIHRYKNERHKNILKFHNTTHGDDSSKDVRSKFKGDLRTVSITQIENSDENGVMKYYDLDNDLEKHVAIKQASFNA